MKKRLAACFVGMVILVGTVRVAPAVDYTYDVLQRLTRVDYASGASIAYSYDAAGNRLTLVLQAKPPGDDFAYMTNSGTITITKYAGTSGAVTIPGTINGLPVTSIGANAFYSCTNMISVTIPESVTSIGDGAFSSCTSLVGVYFRGNAPSIGSTVFSGGNNTTVYYLPGHTGWGATFGGCSSGLWKPQVQTSGTSFGVRANQFGFTLDWASGMDIVVEARAGLANSTWLPLQTNTLSSDSLYFSDPQWTNYPARLYRVRSP